VLREEFRLRMPEKRVVKRIFGSGRNNVTEGWKKLNNEELCNFYHLLLLL
jgi:hypothetical protein